MFIVLYAFRVKPNLEKTFIVSWKNLTTSIYKHEGSLGSRLHKKDAQNYIAYAQWPSKIQFEDSGKNSPGEVSRFSKSMRDSCEKIEVIEKLEVVEDLLMEKQNQESNKSKLE